MDFNKNSSRTHDNFYTEEDYFTKPKEVFKLILPIILNNLNSGNNQEAIKLLDVGCANGDFLRFIHNSIDNSINISYYGLDVMNNLLEIAKKKFSKATYYKADIRDYNQLKEVTHSKVFDIVLMLAVHSAFDELDWIKNLISILEPKGSIILSGIFNPYPYDVFMRVKKSESTHLEEGWNVHSKQSIKEYCKKLNFEASFYDFEPDVELGRRQEDGLRSWTIDLNHENNVLAFPKEETNVIVYERERKRIFTNATRIIHDWSFCVIKKI